MDDVFNLPPTPVSTPVKPTSYVSENLIITISGEYLTSAEIMQAIRFLSELK